MHTEKRFRKITSSPRLYIPNSVSHFCSMSWAPCLSFISFSDYDRGGHEMKTEKNKKTKYKERETQKEIEGRIELGCDSVYKCESMTCRFTSFDGPQNKGILIV